MKNILFLILLSLPLLGCDFLKSKKECEKNNSGVFVMSNISKDHYETSISGNNVIIAGGKSKSYDLPIGTYTLTVKQINGYTFYPSEKSYVIKINQCELTTINFP